MLKVWGRKTSSNVQKVMWAIGDLEAFVLGAKDGEFDVL
jgi:hypothetical protein